ncbi:MAG: hypothetical protein LBT53_09420 [Puniceicoccales bacterium]|jgi:hypothetical protein|nr:hypothetical protein [Puniceicoccales bacterium]
MAQRNLFIGALLACAGLVFTGCPSGESTKNAVAAAAKKTVGVAKSAVAGVAQGVDEGRKETVGLDGAHVVSTYAEITKLLGIELLKVGADDKGHLRVTLGFANNTDTPVRMSGWGTKTEILVLDKDGYVKRLTKDLPEITIPAKAKDKVDFHFDIAPDKAVTMRFFEGEISLVTKEAAQNKTQNKAQDKTTNEPSTGQK